MSASASLSSSYCRYWRYWTASSTFQNLENTYDEEKVISPYKNWCRTTLAFLTTKEMLKKILFPENSLHMHKIGTFTFRMMSYKPSSDHLFYKKYHYTYTSLRRIFYFFLLHVGRGKQMIACQNNCTHASSSTRALVVNIIKQSGRYYRPYLLIYDF